MNVDNSLLFNFSLMDKAYLIEFYNGEILENSFSFCLPPENEQNLVPQRIFETKTYEGAVIDDYGNDTETITLSGSTYNSELRLIYTGNGMPRAVSGESEIYTLRDLLRTFGRKEKLIDKHVYLYDLAAPKVKTWEVYPKELRIERSKDRPFSYNYSFTLLATETEKRRISRFNWVNELNTMFNRFVTFLVGGLAILMKGMSFFESVVDMIHVIENTIAQTESILASYVDVANGYLNAGTNVIKETVGLGDYVISTPLRVNSMGISVFNSTKKLLESCNDLKSWVRNIDSNKEFEKSSDIISRQYNASAEEIVDEWNILTNQMCEKAEEIHAISMMATSSSGFVVEPGGENNDTVRLVYGIKEKILTDNDSWDSIANDAYGDPSLGKLLASYNGTFSEESNSDIVAGKKIYLPILEEAQSTSDNQVYNAPGTVDNYGNDILINDNGDYDVHNGDFACASGVQNLTQALMSRLCTSINNRIRNTLYGIKNSVGYTVAIANKYLAASIMQTVLMDPRVNEVQGMEWNGSGSSVQIDFTYTDINDQNQEYRG